MSKLMNWIINWVASSGKRYWVDFDGDSSLINCGADASLEDLHGFAGFTVDGWIYIPDEQLAHYGTIASKYDNIEETPWGWYFVMDYDTSALSGAAIYQTIAATSTTIQLVLVVDWTHVLMCFNPVDAKLYMAIDGVWCTYSDQTAAVGVIGTDVGIDFLMGAMYLNSAPTLWYRGGLQWLRLSTGVRYDIGAPFAVPHMCPPPNADGTTVEIWALDEGYGTLANSTVQYPTNNGTIVDGTWHECVEE